MTNDAPAIIPAAGLLSGDVYLEGTSNAPQLYFFEESDNDFFIIQSVDISTNGGSTWQMYQIGSAISGDPGARAAYKWRATASCESNPTVSTRPATVTIGYPAHGTPSLSLSATSVTLESNGAAKTITVTSNAPFTVS